MYEPEDMMIDMIRDNYNILQSLGSFGISLGFGDKTVEEVCQEQGVDTFTFLAVVNFTIRYRSDVKPGMWVRFQGEKWDISTLGEYQFKRTYLGLKASLSKGVSG